MKAFDLPVIFSSLLVGLVVHVNADNYIKAPASGTIQAPTSEWIEKIHSLAPAEATRVPARPRRILVFSKTTGFVHKVAPHVVEVTKVLSGKSGAFEVVVNDDVRVLEKEHLAKFDAVMLNNTCPKNPKRDLFFDALADEQKAAELEANLLEYVENGGGLVVIHGAIAFQIHSPEISEMIGGSFNWHPKSQMVTLDLVDSSHPLVAAFDGQGFIHFDEPYLFKNAYQRKNFRPLLEMDISKLDPETLKKTLPEDEYYVAWIKRHGTGRVFYCSPSHYPASYETKAMLRFLLDGIQYALGDLECDDSPIGAE